MLQHFTTQGKRYPVNFGIRTIVATADALGITIDKLTRDFLTPDMSLGDLVNMVTTVASVAMTEGARKVGTPHTYTQDDVVDMIDEDAELLPKIVDMFRSSLGTGTPVFPKAAAPESGKVVKAVAEKPKRKR